MTHLNLAPAWALLLVGTSLFGPAITATNSVAASAYPQYVVAAHWIVAGEGGWDYLTLDQDTHRLFVTHGDRIEVIDTGTGKLVGQIANTIGVHGVALAPDLKRGFSSNGRANSVTAFELGSVQPIKTVKVSGKNPDAIYYDQATRRVFTFNGKSANATVLNALTLEIEATIPLTGKPEFVASDGDGHLYVNIETGSGKMQLLDTRTLKVRATWPLPGCANPSGLAIDIAHRRVFSLCENLVMVVTDADTGQQVARVPIGADPDAAAFDAATGLIFSSNGESGTLTVVKQLDPNHYRVVANLATQVSARTMALDTHTHRIYLAAAAFAPVPQGQPEQQRPRMMPNTFSILVAEPRKELNEDTLTR